MIKGEVDETGSRDRAARFNLTANEVQELSQSP
jgi:hypothetical protein